MGNICRCLNRNEGQRTRATSEETHISSHVTKDYESLDYDRCYNIPYVAMMAEHMQDKWFLWKIEIMKWVVAFLVGVLTAVVALFIDQVVKVLTTLKLTTVDHSITQYADEGYLVISLLILLAFSLFFVFIAAMMTYIEPVSAGSGIPEIKCYLNGVVIPRCVRMKTLVCKAVGVLFSVSGGLFVGKEGPMIHSGAVIGAGVPQFESFAFESKLGLNIPFFRSDRDKRDFVSMGAAAGVAAAFGSPIGGTLFSLEEGSSFWNQKLTWRTFFCAMTASFTLNFFKSGFDMSLWGQFYTPGLINFGEFKCPEIDKKCHLWQAWDLTIFLAIAVGGGLMGAAFNTLNLALTKYRLKYVTPKGSVAKILEALLVATGTTVVAFTASMTLGECRKIENYVTNTTYSGMRVYFCEEGYFNDMATLMFNSQETTIKQLLHQSSAFSPVTLFIFMVFFYVLSCWTYGVSVPSGLFVPSLLCGAAYGRLVANLLEHIGYDFIYPGTYALVGAAAFLGGVVRMTISLTCILLEATNEISYGLPIMGVLMIAKWVGDLFNESLYDIHIEIKDVPLLGWEAPPKLERLQASDIMSKDVSYMFPQSRVTSVVNMLATTRHHAYPVVTQSVSSEPDTSQSQDADVEVTRRSMRSQSAGAEMWNRGENLEMLDSLQDSGKSRELGVIHSGPHKPLKFEGIILRQQLIAMLEKAVCYSPADKLHGQRSMSYAELTSAYPRYPDIQDLGCSSRHTDDIMDLHPYMNPSPYTVTSHTPVPQVFNLFRGLGLRHLPVTDMHGHCVGMITRHNLTEHNLKHVVHAMAQRERLAQTAHSEDHDPLQRYFSTSTRVNN